MSVAGIDYSTRAVDVVLLDEDTDAATWHRFELTGDNAFDRARSVRRAMWGWNGWDDCLAVGIEDPRGYNAGSLYRVQGAILSRIPILTLVHPLIPSQWRKTVGLPGNASKDDVALFAIDRWADRNGGGVPYCDGETQDTWDAYSIALATRTLLERVPA
jgi:hypothetical protein